MVGSFASIHGYHMLSSIILLNHEHTPIEVMFFLPVITWLSHFMVVYQPPTPFRGQHDLR